MGRVPNTSAVTKGVELRTYPGDCYNPKIASRRGPGRRLRPRATSRAQHWCPSCPCVSSSPGRSPETGQPVSHDPWKPLQRKAADRQCTEGQEQAAGTRRDNSVTKMVLLQGDAIKVGKKIQAQHRSRHSQQKSFENKARWSGHARTCTQHFHSSQNRTLSM